MSLRDTILNAKDTPLTPVPVEEWGCTVFIKRLTVGERIPLLNALSEKGQESKVVGVVAFLYAVVDEAGRPIFNPEDYDAVMNKAGDVVLRLGGRAARINGLFDGEQVSEAKKG